MSAIEAGTESELKGKAYEIFGPTLYGKGRIHSGMTGLLARREGIPGPHLVRIFDRTVSFSSAIAQVISDANGQWEVTGLSERHRYMVMISSLTKDISSAIVDWVRPEGDYVPPPRPVISPEFEEVEFVRFVGGGSFDLTGEIQTEITVITPWQTQVGDRHLIYLLHRSELTVPSGWVLVEESAQGDFDQQISVYTLVATQSGVRSFIFEQESSVRLGAIIQTFRHKDGTPEILDSGNSLISQSGPGDYPVHSIALPTGAQNATISTALITVYGGNSAFSISGDVVVTSEQGITNLRMVAGYLGDLDAPYTFEEDVGFINSTSASDSIQTATVLLGVPT